MPESNDCLRYPSNAAEYREWYLANKPEGVEWGECWCGCKQKTRVSPKTQRDEIQFLGEPRRFLLGHYTSGSQLKSGLRYIEQDCGYGTPCWLWQMNILASGYAQTWYKGRPYRAHKFYYEQTFGPVPDGHHLHHLCAEYGGPKHCVNPHHLAPLTFTEHRRLNSNIKLSMAKAREIRRLYASGEWSQHKLARRFGVCQDAISNVVHHITWRE